MEELIKAMSNEELEAIKASHKDNASILTLIDGILEARQREIEQARIAKEFEAKVAKLAKLPAPPANVYNLYLSWQQRDFPVGEPEVIHVNEKGEPDGKPITSKVLEEYVALEGDKATEYAAKHGLAMRQGMEKRWTWIVETNKGFTTSKSQASTTTTASKRAISVYKFNGSTNDFKGNFPSASKACEHLSIPIGGDSAMRVLAREGYITQPYTGTDYTAS